MIRKIDMTRVGKEKNRKRKLTLWMIKSKRKKGKDKDSLTLRLIYDSDIINIPIELIIKNLDNISNLFFNHFISTFLTSKA